MTLVEVLVALLLVVGLAGSVLPVLPGAILIYAAVWLHAISTGFDPIGPWRLLILGLLTVAAYALEYLAGALGVRRFGGSAWATAGAILGAVVGIFFGLPGLLLGPLAGAVVAEYAYTRRLDTSARAALGTVIGLLVGAVAKFGLSLVIILLFAFWVWRG